MSLQELAGHTVHLKLTIREGHGFGFLTNPIVVVAGTNGIFLETEVVPPSPDPQFHIDLVWETDKKNLRRFRASNTPLKLECFTIGSNNQREGIGSILLNIKSAQVIVRGSQNNANEKWHRLIGVPMEAKALQPELLLSLTIQEPNALSQPLSIQQEEKGPLELIVPAPRATADSAKMCKPQLLSVPRPVNKQGYTQLGPESLCVNTFLLSLHIQRALEMKLLFRDGHEHFNSDNSSPFHITLSVMDQTKSTKSFPNASESKAFILDENIVFPLRTSLHALNSYLQENPCAGICLFYCGEEVAAAELHIRSLVPTNDVHIFSREFNGGTALTQNCILVSSRSGSIPLQGNLQPSLEVTSRLQLVASVTTSQLPHEWGPATSTQNTNFDQGSSSRSESRQSQDTFIVTNQSGPVWVPVVPGETQPSLLAKIDEANTVQIESPDMVHQQQDGARPIPAHKFLDKTGIRCETISLSQREMEDVMHSLSKVESQSNLERNIHQEVRSVTCQSCASKNVISSSVPNATLLDNNTAYRIVEELEDWKEKQQEIFRAELKQEEIEHITRITDEWTAQMKAQNAELDSKVAECKTLAESLSITKQDLRERLKVCATRELELRNAKEELDRQYNLKFQELTLAARRLDEEVKLKISLADTKFSKLEERIKELETENETLRSQLRKRASVPSACTDNQTCGMTHNQVSHLLTQVDQLEGKLKASLQSKVYFKEQWGRAVREMNQAKLQFSNTAENNKCLETLLGKEEKALQNDQKTLNKIRQEIAHLSL